MSNAAPGPGPEHTHDTLLPRPPGGTAQGAALSVLVHGGLVAALAGPMAILARILTPQAPAAAPLLPEAAVKGLEQLGAALADPKR